MRIQAKFFRPNPGSFYTYKVLTLDRIADVFLSISGPKMLAHETCMNKTDCSLLIGLIETFVVHLYIQQNLYKYLPYITKLSLYSQHLLKIPWIFLYVPPLDINSDSAKTICSQTSENAFRRTPRNSNQPRIWLHCIHPIFSQNHPSTHQHPHTHTYTPILRGKGRRGALISYVKRASSIDGPVFTCNRGVTVRAGGRGKPPPWSSQNRCTATLAPRSGSGRFIFSRFGQSTIHNDFGIHRFGSSHLLLSKPMH